MENVQTEKYGVRVMGTDGFETVTDAFKRLLKRSGLTMDALAKKIGLKGRSSLQHYVSEEKFKKKYFPLDLVEKLAAVMTGLGSPPISRDEVMALAGTKASANNVVSFDVAFLADLIASIERVNEVDRLRLSPEMRAHWAVTLYIQDMRTSKPNLRDEKTRLTVVQQKLLGEN